MPTASGLPAPKMPPVPKVTSVEQLLPNLRIIVKRKPANMIEGLNVKPGEKVLILSDSTISPLLTEAFPLAVKEAGGTVEVITVEGYPNLREPVDLVDQQFSNNWFPDRVWEAAAKADVFLHLAFLKGAHTPNLPFSSESKPRMEEWELSLDLLASDYVTYPIEVRDAISQNTWDTILGAREIRLYDPLGTDLTFRLTPSDWEEKGRGGEEKQYMAGHLMLPIPRKEVDGVLVTTSVTFGGPIPNTRLTLKGRQVVQVEGGGPFGKRLKESFERYKDVVFPGKPGPGANWLSTFSICTHPKARPSPAYDQLAGSARVQAWCTGHRRSGIIHSSIGMAMVNPKYKVVRHMDFPFTTLTADAKTIIDRGHLTALDDPEVRQIAAQYGDPDQLLTEDWIPAVLD